MKKVITNVLMLALLIFVAGCGTTRVAEAPSGPHFRLLTYNVNWGAPRPEDAAEILRACGADIICLQETTPEWQRFLRASLQREYPFAEFRTSPGRAGGGLAFLSKSAGREVAYIPSGTGWFDGWIKSFDTPAGAVQVLNVHLRPPVSDSGGWVKGYFTTRDDRVREMETFFANRTLDIPALVVGDFNDGEDSRVVSWLEKRGLRNALPQFDRNTATWQWRTSAGTLRRRMDHVLYSPDLYCSSARVIKAGASDHFPVEAIFQRRSPERIEVSLNSQGIRCVGH